MAETLTFDAAAGGVASRDYRRDAAGSAISTLIVENMVCGGCMRKVEIALAAVPGVSAVRANLSARRVSVVRAIDQVAIADLVAALDRVGFTAVELAAATEPVTRKAEQDLLRRAAISGFAAANVMLLSVSVWSGGEGDMSPSIRALFHWLSAAIALPTVAYAGQPFFRSALQALAARRLNMDVPISLGVLLATAMSLYQTIAGTEQVYFDAAVTLIFFLLLGRFLDTRMRVRAEGAAANLLALKSIRATVRHADGTVETLASAELVAGMHVLVAAGERVAIDGRVIAGRGDIDEAIITGESLPRTVTVGDSVYAGSISIDGALTIEATGTDDATLLSEIGRLMMAAKQGRGRTVRLADRAARIYAPAVHILSFATFAAWMLLGADWQAALTAAIAVLIITCPCALALAVPAVQVAASSRLFAQGIIVKAADGLERLAEVDTVVFDKTGTLTTGQPRLRTILNGGDAELQRAASLAAASRHPYARALVAAARDRGLAVTVADGVIETPGCGLSCPVAGGTLRLGSATWCGIDEVDGAVIAALWLCPPDVAGDGAPVGFVFDESVRSDAAEVVVRLAKAGLDVELLSGDRNSAVGDIALRLGIAHWQGRQNPADKFQRLEQLAAAGRRVLMVGDGLNDAPALAAAYASISPASAADISQTTADMIFQGEKLAGVIEAVAVAREAHRMALQNFAIALCYNALFVPLAMAGIVTPLIAAIAMSASSIGVTANAARLRHKTIRFDS